MTRRIAICAGGTAGHVLPAVTIANEYRRRHGDVDVMFIGSQRGFEGEIVPAAGFRLATVAAAPWLRVGWLGKARALASMAAGAIEARRLLATAGSELVIGFGGYASAGAVLAARSLGLPIVLHEPNAQPGLTQRRLAPLADRIHLGFEQARRHFAAERTRVTGTPVRRELFTIGAERQPPTESRPAQLLITGGSLGDHFLNHHVPPLLARLVREGARLEVRHQTGLSEMEPVVEAYRSADIPAEVVAFIEDMPDAYRRADLAISCGGAITLAELSAAALPCLIVPLTEASEDHQSANAEAFAAVTGAHILRPRDWQDERATEALSELLRDRQAWARAAAALKGFARRDAAEAIVDDCESLLDRPSDQRRT